MPSARTLRAGRAVIELSLLTGDVEKQLKRLEMRMRNFGKTLSSIGSGGLKFSGAIAGLLGFPVKMAADLEKTRAEFTALLGDAGNANKLLSEIEGFALVTPLGTQALGDAARRLLVAGVALDDIMPKLRQIGEVAAGDAEKLDRLALAFGQVVAKGRLMGQEANQMAESGFSPLAEISRTTGESMGELMKRMEDGGISVEEVANAFKTATASGGRFNGLLAKIAATTSGKFNELKESIAVAVRPIGDALLPVLNEWMDTAKKTLPAVGLWIKQNKESVKVIAQVAAVIGVASAALVALGTVIAAATAVLNPYVLAIAAAATTLGILYANLDKITQKTKEWKSALDAIVPPGGLLDLLKKLIEIRGLQVEIAKNATTPIFTGEDGKSVGGKGGFFSNGETIGGGGGFFSNGRGLDDPIAADAAQKTSTAPGTIDINSIWGAIVQKATAASMNAQGAFNKEQSGLQVWLDGAQMHLERSRDILSEQQAVDDEIARTRIMAMKDELAKEKALINLETQIRMRELQERGLLTDEMKAKLLELQGAQLGAAGLGVNDRLAQNEALFDARFAAQIFGGNKNEELQQLRQIARNTDPRKQKQGVDVV